ncbi:MAG: mechanosensitive ion channel family protein [Magnetococcales bacterium]|nr:mechanosensitive ion channel family protein [Magnetococcales bacterium]
MTTVTSQRHRSRSLYGQIFSLVTVPLLVMSLGILLSNYVVTSVLHALGLQTITILKGAEFLMALGLVWACVRVLNALFWHLFSHHDPSFSVPALLNNISLAILWMFGIAIISALAFKTSMVGLITTSSVTLAVIGFALKNTITDLFSGIAISVEHAFKVGDWLEMDNGIVAQVEDMTWRTTQLMTKDGRRMIVPNGKFSSQIFYNHDNPTSIIRSQLDVTLDYAVTGYQAERILISSALQVADVAAQDKKPIGRIVSLSERGVVWRVFFWNSNYDISHGNRYKVHRNILRNLHLAGLRVPAMVWQRNSSGTTTTTTHTDQKEILAFIARIPLFRLLSEKEKRYIAQHSELRWCGPGTPVVQQDEPGDSLFVIKEGHLSITINDDHGKKQELDQLGPGKFFGEMSLLTGAPRSATVTPLVESSLFEIDKEILAPIIEERQELIEELSIILADRALQTRNSMAVDEAVLASNRSSLTVAFIGKMKRFFKMTGA